MADLMVVSRVVLKAVHWAGWWVAKKVVSTVALTVERKAGPWVALRVVKKVATKAVDWAVRMVSQRADLWDVTRAVRSAGCLAVW
jgi:hypothetical protein